MVISTNTNLVTVNFHNDNANRFVNAIANGIDSYYVFAGTSVPFFAGLTPTPYDDVFDTVVDVYSSILFGKQIVTNDVCLVVPNNPYVANIVYAMYDDSDPLIFTKQFFVMTNMGEYTHVFKCLDNNNGTPSTVPPNFADIDAADDSYWTSDGYLWKYMYSVDVATVNKFSTASWFPYVANTVVQQAAVPGAIDVIQTLQGGNGYNNYLSGIFSVTDIRLNGNDYIYSVNAQGSPVNYMYNDCIIYITSDVLGNSAGQFSKIINYAVNSTTKWIQLETPFVNVPLNGATYQIYPSVTIQGSGRETNTAIAWAVVNAVTNSVAYTQMLYKGSGYTFASATINAAPWVGVTTPASLHPIYSPPGGHGANGDKELGATAACVSMSFIETEGNTIFSNCDYQRIGIVKNPLFANVEVHMSSNSSIYLTGEPIYDVSLIAIKATGSGVYGYPTITAPDSDFINQLNVGDKVVISDGVNYQFNSVYSILSSNNITMANNLITTSNTITIYIANVISSGVVIDVNYGVINIDQVTNPMNINDYLIGGVSGSYGKIGAIYRSGIQKNFNTFLGTWQYTGMVIGGTFSLNEEVEKNLTENHANGYLASISSNQSVLYMSNVMGIFNINDTLIGNASGASFLMNGYWEPEIAFGGGDILYMENFSAITRASTTSETFKLVLTF